MSNLSYHVATSKVLQAMKKSSTSLRFLNNLLSYSHFKILFFFEDKDIDHIEMEFTVEYKIKQRASNLDKVNFGLNLLDLLD